jgi:hypothetical protein
MNQKYQYGKSFTASEERSTDPESPGAVDLGGGVELDVESERDKRTILSPMISVV